MEYSLVLPSRGPPSAGDRGSVLYYTVVYCTTLIVQYTKFYSTKCRLSIVEYS